MVKTIIRMGATWCAPCRAFAATFEKVKEMEEYSNIEFEEIDIENDEEGGILAEKYQVRSVPTTVLLDENNNLIYKVSGNISLNDFKKIIDEALKN